jgi:hypothetical protein
MESRGGTASSIDDTNYGIFVYGLDTTRIEQNQFDQVGQGIKVCFSQPYSSRDVYIGHNMMKHIHRMGMELQGAMGCGASKPAVDGPNTENIVIEFNRMSPWIDPYWNSFGISFADPPPDGARGVTIQNNFVVAGKAASWAQEGKSGKYGYGLEVAGLGLDVSGNVIAGYFGQSITVGAGSRGAQIHHNFACALESGPPMEMGPEQGPSPGARYYTNTVLASCPATLPEPAATAMISSLPVP